MNPLEQISKRRGVIMGLAIIAILLYHQYFVNAIWLQAFVRFGGWGVEIFMFVSGLGIAYSLGKNSLSRYYSNRLLRILPAYFIAIGLLFLTLLYWGGDIHPARGWMPSIAGGSSRPSCFSTS